jgi:tRNA(Arg) A34 adenosine deaminase TadA
MSDAEFMRRAIRLADERMRAGEGGPFGAVVARDGRIVGEGWNRVIGTNDPTAHAEVVAIRDACARLGTFDLSGATIYTSCEPCPMCLGAILWARIDRMCYAADRIDAAKIGFDDEAFYVEVAKPLHARTLPAERILADEARAVFAAWFAKPDRIEY